LAIHQQPLHQQLFGSASSSLEEVSTTSPRLEELEEATLFTVIAFVEPPFLTLPFISTSEQFCTSWLDSMVQLAAASTMAVEEARLCSAEMAVLFSSPEEVAGVTTTHLDHQAMAMHR